MDAVHFMGFVAILQNAFDADQNILLLAEGLIFLMMFRALLSVCQRGLLQLTGDESQILWKKGDGLDVGKSVAVWALNSVAEVESVAAGLAK